MLKTFFYSYLSWLSDAYHLFYYTFYNINLHIAHLWIFNRERSLYDMFQVGRSLSSIESYYNLSPYPSLFLSDKSGSAYLVSYHHEANSDSVKLLELKSWACLTDLLIVLYSRVWALKLYCQSQSWNDFDLHFHYFYLTESGRTKLSVNEVLNCYQFKE